MSNALCTTLIFIGSLLFSGGFSQSPGGENVEDQSLLPADTAGGVPEGVPLSLGAAIQIGLENNPEIAASLERAGGAVRGRRLSAVSPSPADFSFTNDYVPKGRGLRDYGERTVGVSQTIEFPTNYLFRGSKYSIEKKIAEIESERVKLDVVSKVKTAYFTVCALQEQVKIAVENLDIANDFVRKAEVRHSVGEGTNLEKLTAKVSAAEAKSNVAVVKNRLGSALAELNYCMGYGKGETTAYRPVDSLRFVRCDVTLDQLVDDAASSHPLIRESVLLVRSSKVDKTLAVSSILPEFNVGFFNKQVSGDATGYYGASLSLGVPLWFMMDQRGKIMEASSNEAAARADLKAVNNAVYTKISTAFTGFRHEESQVRLYVDEILPQSGAIYRTAAKSYEAGEITYIEFLQAQQTLIQSKGGYIDALLSYNLSIVAIEEAVGKTLK